MRDHAPFRIGRWRRPARLPAIIGHAAGLTLAVETAHRPIDTDFNAALALSPTNHHASAQSFLSQVKTKRRVPVMEAPLSF